MQALCIPANTGLFQSCRLYNTLGIISKLFPEFSESF